VTALDRARELVRRTGSLDAALRLALEDGDHALARAVYDAAALDPTLDQRRRPSLVIRRARPLTWEEP